MRTVTGLFDTRDDAHHAVSALKDAGVPSDDISMVSNHAEHADDDDVAEGAGTGAGIGAAVGGAGGLLAGLGMIAIPGIGPVDQTLPWGSVFIPSPIPGPRVNTTPGPTLPSSRTGERISRASAVIVPADR